MVPFPSVLTDLGAERRCRWALFFGVVILVSTAWVHDDAYISLRTIDNLLAGHGLRWNAADRVQVFTHPLWLALEIPVVAVTRSAYVATVALSLLFSVATLWLLVTRLAASPAAGFLALVPLLLSKAYVDYASSGLEDPLTRFLLVLLALALLRLSRQRLLVTSLLASLGALSRPDAFLLFLPALAQAIRRDQRATGCRVASVLFGLVPLVAWGVFATFYFGSPLPNTAFAKLVAGVPWPGRALQGLAYVASGLVSDPATPLVLVAGSLWALKQRDSPLRPLVWGAWLYLAYVVWIGGDYMAGRFLGAPLLAIVVACVASTREALPVWTRARPWLVAALVWVVIARLGSSLDDSRTGALGLGDERRIYAPFTGLVAGIVTKVSDPAARWPDHYWRAAGEEARRRGEPVWVTGNVGLFGYYAGPGVHIVDPPALTDPFLARLPADIPATYNLPNQVVWRAGHLDRKLPQGYLETLSAGSPRFSEPELEVLWSLVETVHRGPALASGRLAAIVALLRGAYKGDLRAYVERHPDQFGIARP